MPEAQRVNGVYTFTPGGEPKVGFCDHTASGFYNTMLNPSFWNISAGCSVHFAVARDGRIAQIVSIFDRAWGQGRLGPSVSWPPYPQMGYRNPNEYLISIEHEDWTTVNGVSQPVPNAEWTDAEYQADQAVKRWCLQHMEMRFGIDSLASHYMFDSVNRANCAGNWWKSNRTNIYADLTGSVENEMRLVAHNAIAEWWTDRVIEQTPSDAINKMWASEFGLPEEAQWVRLGIYLKAESTGYLRFFNNGDSRFEAEPIGWGQKGIFQTADVQIAQDRSINYRIEGGSVATTMIRSLAYFT